MNLVDTKLTNRGGFIVAEKIVVVEKAEEAGEKNKF